jgi:hypothetical protein
MGAHLRECTSTRRVFWAVPVILMLFGQVWRPAAAAPPSPQATAGEQSLPLCSYPAYPRYTGGAAGAAGSYRCER